MSDNENDLPCAACDGGTLTTRRAFLQMAAAFALPVAFAEGAATGSERRYPIPAGDGVTIA